MSIHVLEPSGFPSGNNGISLHVLLVVAFHLLLVLYGQEESVKFATFVGFRKLKVLKMKIHVIFILYH